ncbi:MAG: ribonucleoside-diphosphate reductase subunit alpha [Thermoanaerobaculia bacterium]
MLRIESAPEATMQPTKVVKRSGEIVEFDEERIRNAILKAVMATGKKLSAASVDAIVDCVVEDVRRQFAESYPSVENIQDLVEKNLVLAGRYEIAKAYILYRAERRKSREEAKKRAIADARLGRLTIGRPDGSPELFDVEKIEQLLRRIGDDLGDAIDVDHLVQEVISNVYDGISSDEIGQALVLATTTFIERHPAYSRLAARLVLQTLYSEVFGCSVEIDEVDSTYREAFVSGIRYGSESGLLDPRLADFDLGLLAASLSPERDLLFEYVGIQTLCDRYLIRRGGRCLELPQIFWMRVAMGLALEETDCNERAMDFYELMSKLLFVPSTPTLFYSGTACPQLSSCYLTTIDDDLDHIFKSLADNAQMAKWSGGLGNDWTNLRATGSSISSSEVESQGVVPFLKIANDVTLAIGRSAKRRGATCAYLETWHLDIEDFLDLRRHTGDERRRTRDLNTANWVPDLFVKRVLAEKEWTLFSPDDVPDLHGLYGQAFEKRYVEYELMAEYGKIDLFRRVSAKSLWRKMLTALFETGHPLITFKDACNIRSPQDHAGVIHSSNFCTEITLNTSVDETAVCNLGSVDLARHIKNGGLDSERLAATVKTAIRMLDNVVDINYYPTPEARNSNLKHRAIGLGIMGFQDALYELDLPFESEGAMDFADQAMELVSYHAILASSRLARERGPYASYGGSKWDRGLLPLDTVDLLEKERGVPIDLPRTQRLDWTPVRDQVRRHGMRNSNLMAIAPTATISDLSGCSPCIEPIYKNIWVMAVGSGEFTVVNPHLVGDLERLGLWGDDMLEQIRFCDGSLSLIPEIPQQLKEKYKQAFEVDPICCLRMTAMRGKWIDQSQSHTIFVKGGSGRVLSDVYLAAWRLGLKTTYHLRTPAAGRVEDKAVDASEHGLSRQRDHSTMAADEDGGTGARVTATRPGSARSDVYPL